MNSDFYDFLTSSYFSAPAQFWIHFRLSIPNWNIHIYF